MSLDFIERLAEHIGTLQLDFQLHIGSLDTKDSIALNALAGGRTIRSFYDGVSDKRLPFEFSIKTTEQKRATDALNDIARNLEELSQLPSGNGSYDFQDIILTDEPFSVGQDEKGFFFYRLTIQTNLTVFKQKG